jgi:protein-L-isoaspartate(D-aspartate) O-methyltransferase
LFRSRCAVFFPAKKKTSARPEERTSRIEEETVERKTMVRTQIEARGVRNPVVLDAMRSVERHRFVPETERAAAYEDHPLPIGNGQTISQPYIVALMTELLDPKIHHKVLEIGTGSGYQTAVLAEVVGQVFSIEIVEPLGKQAEQTLKELGYDNVHLRVGDGYRGWPEEAPFDGILVTAAPPHIPQPLIDQLKIGGRMVIPVGESWWGQQLQLLVKNPDGKVEVKRSIGVRFVPMTGEAQEEKP